MATKLSPEQKQIKELRRELREVRNAANEFYRSVEFPHKLNMWHFKADSTSYSLASTYERCAAAAQLGYFCKLNATTDGAGRPIVEVVYVKKPKPRPWQFDY
jgi:hypothetical protein